MTITVHTRSQNEELYNKMRSLIPSNVKCIQDKGYSKWEDAVNFLHDAIDNTRDMLLIIDEDAFVTDWEAIENLCAFVKENGYTHAGMPDGGVIIHRFHSYQHINPFFVVFNCNLINTIKANFSRKVIDATVFDEKKRHIKPDWIQGRFSHDNIEPFAGLFYWLVQNGKPYFLKAATLWDGISTKVIDPQDPNIDYCLHSWYSREYTFNPLTKMRIDFVYEVARFNNQLSFT